MHYWLCLCSHFSMYHMHPYSCTCRYSKHSTESQRIPQQSRQQQSQQRVQWTVPCLLVYSVLSLHFVIEQLPIKDSSYMHGLGVDYVYSQLLTRGVSGYSSLLGNLSVSGQAESTPRAFKTLQNQNMWASYDAFKKLSFRVLQKNFSQEKKLAKTCIWRLTWGIPSRQSL